MPHRKFKRAVIIVTCSLFAALVLSDLWVPYVFGGFTKNAYALLRQDAPTDKLPQELSIAIDGYAATFHKGDLAYDTFLRLLRTAQSTDDILAAGPHPSFSISTRSRCGELTIPYFLRVLCS